MSENPMLDKNKKFVENTETDNVTDDIQTNDESAGSEFVNIKIEEKIRSLKLDDLVRPARKIEERSSIAIKLKKSIADKVKAYAFSRNLTVTEVLEDIINSMFKDEELDKKALKKYNDKYKKKGASSSPEANPEDSSEE